MLDSGQSVRFERMVMQNTTVRCYEPEVHDPYPDRRWSDIRDFKYESDLHLLRLRCGLSGIRREAQYVVAKPYMVSFELDNEGTRRNISCPRGCSRTWHRSRAHFGGIQAAWDPTWRLRSCTTFCTWHGRIWASRRPEACGALPIG